MKNLFALAVLVFVVAACNLSDRFKKSETSSSNSNSSSSSSKTGTSADEPAEKPNPTAAQTAALANGQEIKWDEQGMTWTVPAGWKKMNADKNTFQAGANGAFLIVSISAMSDNFPTAISLNATHEGAKVRKKNGEVDELKWLELDGVRGVAFRESKPQMADDIRRMQWMTYRKFANQTQLVNLMVTTSGGKWDSRSDELYAIFYSTKLVH